MTVRDWIAQGVAAGFCTEVACATHNPYPLYTEEEIEQGDDLGDDPCLPVVRLLYDDETWMNRVAEMEAVIGDLVDADECYFDHHGHCQAHNWFAVAPPCPHARAKRLLA